MKTDKWFFQLFLSQPGMIGELMSGVPRDVEYEYHSIAVKEKGFVIDGVLKPLGDRHQAPLIFLEAQMQGDMEFYRRYFAEIFLYLWQYPVDYPWRGLLILRSRGQNLGSPVVYQTLLAHHVDCLYLKDLLPLTDLTPNLMLMKLLVLSQRQGAEVARTVLSTAETREEYLRRLSLVETILVNKFPELSTAEIVKMLNLPTVDITQSRFYQEVSQAGRQEGRQEEAATLILSQLARRCGDLPVVLAERVSALSLTELEELGVALLDFTGVGDLESWLGRR